MSDSPMQHAAEALNNFNQAWRESEARERGETIARDAAIYGTTYSYDGRPLDPTKVVMHMRRANGEITSTVTEYGIVYGGGAVLVRPNTPEVDRAAPLDQWIDAEANINRSRVVRRRVLVIDEWEVIATPPALDEPEPFASDREIAEQANAAARRAVAEFDADRGR